MKFFTYNLGCKVNEYETRAVSSILIKAGYSIGDISSFDIALVNTCTVTHVASQKSRQIIRRIRNKNPNAIIVVMGCYSNNNPNVVINECKADIVIGVNHRNEIPNLIKQFIKNKKKIVKVDDVKSLRKDLKYEELGITSFTENTRAYVKIQDGCDNFCSYCIIPITRGRARSRDKSEIFCEISSLLSLGYKEIVLTGIDTSGYGKEFKNYSFSNLLKDILEKFPNLFRLRISSVEITKIDKEFISLLKEHKNIANHIHIPLQSGCDSTLKRMNRKYDTKMYLEKIKEIRRVRKDIAITTDLIVGFPGESEEEFNKTISFIKKIKFKEIHVFPFSKREGTLSFKQKDLDSKIKKERVKKVIELSKKLNKEYEKKFINKTLEVLFEADNSGLTSNYIKVKGKHKPNEIVKMKLTNSNII